jgi:hypothetical protein
MRWHKNWIGDRFEEEKMEEELGWLPSSMLEEVLGFINRMGVGPSSR